MTQRTERRVRVDILLVRRGLARSRNQAQERVREGRVSVAGALCRQAAALVEPDAELVLLPGKEFASRGGKKLDAALDALGIQINDKIVADVGASTGGFTDCVLQRGARRVIAVDVGRDQLDPRLRQDPRVVSRDGVNARDLAAADFGEPLDLAVVDASFISLEKLAPALARVLPQGAELVALVKPQFEVGPALARKSRGVIRDRRNRDQAIQTARRAIESAGFEIRGACDSTVRGRGGNLEHFLYAIRT